MTFKIPFCIQQYVDIDELIQKINEDYKFINFCHKYFTIEEYSLVNFILNEGLRDIRGQEPADDPIIDDDPYARPSETTPNLDPEIDDDPFEKPEGWNPSAGIFYDKETGNLINADGMAVDKDGNVIGPNVPKEDVLQQDWENFFHMKYPDAVHIPPVPKSELDPDYEDFHNWLEHKNNPNDEIPDYGNNEDTGDSNKENPGEVGGDTPLPADDNPYAQDWVDYWNLTHPGEEIENFPQDSDSSADWDDFIEYLQNKYANNDDVDTML